MELSAFITAAARTDLNSMLPPELCQKKTAITEIKEINKTNKV